MQKMSGTDQRVVALVDMDCFYCQVEERLKPELKGTPVAVVQYNHYKGGGIIAVNYKARDEGVTRHMRGAEAKQKCPTINLVSVPTIRGKADLSNYRDAGDEVAQVFSEFSDCVQRASIDEAYLDLTKAVQEAIKNEEKDIDHNDLSNTFVVGYCDLKNKSESERKDGLIQWLKKVEREKTIESSDYQLAVGAKIVEKMRMEIFNRTGFHCSAGIAHNKILAKLTAGLHKPNKQTILPLDSVPELYESLPIQKVKNLGGKLGKCVMEKLSISYMSELYNFSLSQLNQKFDEKTSYWLYNIARGIDLEPVTPRLAPESIGCCKNFRGKSSLKTKSEVEHWLGELASEISERLYKDLEKNNRRAKQLTVSFTQEHPMTRCGALTSYEVSRIVNDALALIRKFNCAPGNEDVWSPPIQYLGLSATKFAEEVSSSIEKYLKTYKRPEKVTTPQDLPSCSNTHKESQDKSKLDLKTESYKQNTSINNFFKENSKNSVKPNATEKRFKPSFFIQFMSTKKEDDATPSSEAENNAEEVEEGVDGTEEDEEDTETWISLSELFPDVNQAEPAVVENLPEPLKKRFKDKLNSINGGQEVNKNPILEALSYATNGDVEAETCKECGKNIPASELPVHLDYHAALKLYSEINKPSSNAVAKVTKPPDKESLNKRKKKREKGTLTPSKKIKSLKSFFTPITKE